MAVHTGSVFGYRGMFDRRGLLIADNLFVTCPTKPGNCRFQHVSLLGHVRRVAIHAPRCRGLVPEPRIRKPCIHILVTFQAHLLPDDTQHPGNIPPMGIVAGNTSSGGERPMDKAALELISFVALEAKRFLRLYEPREPPFSRDLMAELAQILFRQQAICF